MKSPTNPLVRVSFEMVKLPVISVEGDGLIEFGLVVLRQCTEFNNRLQIKVSQERVNKIITSEDLQSLEHFSSEILRQIPASYWLQLPALIQTGDQKTCVITREWRQVSRFDDSVFELVGKPLARETGISLEE